MKYKELHPTSTKIVQNLFQDILEKVNNSKLEGIEIRSLNESLRICNPTFQVSNGKLAGLEEKDIDKVRKTATQIALRKREKGINLDGKKFDLSTPSGYTAALLECKESRFSKLVQMDKFELDEYFGSLYLSCRYDLKESLKFYQWLEQFEICNAINECLEGLN